MLISHCVVCWPPLGGVEAKAEADEEAEEEADEEAAEDDDEDLAAVSLLHSLSRSDKTGEESPAFSFSL